MALFRMVNQLGSALTGSSLRHNVLVNNLANANTPGFKRSDLDFASQLSENISRHYLAKTDVKHLSGRNNRTNQFTVHTDNSSTMRNDGNNVDIEREMALILENQLHYQALSDAVSRKLGTIRSVIGEGRR